jgi:Peptidase family M28
MIRVVSFLVLLSVCLAAQTPRTDPQLAKILQEIRAEVNGNEALDFVTRIYEKDRWQSFAKFQQTAEYLRKTMMDVGLRDVELVSVPADGVTQFGFWTMPLAWDVKQAKLEIIEPAVAPAMRVLADYSKEPASLIMWSGPTPPGGVTAELVELRPASREALKNIDVKGKLVLVDPPLDLSQRGALKAALYKAGAAAMISCATENPDLLDGHYWMNAWGDHGWGFTKTSSPLPGFSITPRQSSYLRNLLANGAKVRAKAIADTRYYSGTYAYVTALIPGSDSAEEVLELGHPYELAQDNATGVAGMLEAIATLNRLIDAGKLARPQRGIRILVMPEDYGSSAYIATHMDRMKRTIGAINMDTPAGPYAETGGYSFAMNPDVSRSYQDALVMRIAENYYAGIPRRFARWTPYRPTSDSFLSDPIIGIPTIAANGSSGSVNVHHNSADTLDKVDPRSLRDLSSIVAGFLYYVASAGEREIPWLAEIATDRAYETTLRAAVPYLNRVAVATKPDALSRELYAGLATIDYNSGRDRDALLSILRLAPASNRDGARALLESWMSSMRRFSAEQGDRLRRAADRRAIELGAEAPVKPIAPPVDLRRAGAEQIIVKRKRFGPVTLDDLALDEREGFPGFAGTPAPLPLLTWCDGKRTLAEVIRLIELEQGPIDFDFVSYFHFLAKHGYVELLSASQ